MCRMTNIVRRRHNTASTNAIMVDQPTKISSDRSCKNPQFEEKNLYMFSSSNHILEKNNNGSKKKSVRNVST